MASPTTTSTGYSIGGSNGSAVTTLVWGTDGLFVTATNNSTTKSPGGSPAFAGTGYYIVESVDQETDSETIYIENGTGQKCARVIINNGQRFTVSVQDDTGMTAPAVGNTVGIRDGAGLIGTIGLVYKAVIVSSGERFTRKGAAMRNLTVESLTLVDNVTGTSVAL